MNFVVYSLPRSRSYWLSRYLSYGDWTCGHEQIRYVRDLDDVRSWLSQDHYGTVETGAAPYWRVQRDICPDAKVAVIRRDPEAVIESVMNCGMPMDRSIITRNIRQLDRKLDQIERHVPNALVLTFEQLREEWACARLFEFCLGERHDHQWWAGFAPLNLQINLRGLVRYEIANQAQLQHAKELMGREVRRLSFQRRKSADLDGFEIQEESFEDWYRDGVALFKEHCVLVGEPPDQYLRKNAPLWRKLDEIGALQIMTARSNGRMFGYLVSVLSPSMEYEDLKIAQQTTFYASPDAKGLGPRLQRASIERLRARGGRWDVIQRAGVRGEGARMGVLYRRMGAEDFGHMYKLSVGAA